MARDRPIKTPTEPLQPQHIPLELLRTFVLIADSDGDASSAGEALGISQPSISKRLSALRQVTTQSGGEPWLILKGKRWLLTAEGQRVRSVVTDLVLRYEQVEQFIAEAGNAAPVVALACGQMAAAGFVGDAVEAFLRANPQSLVRMATPRGRARIEGVAGGQYDLAIVTDQRETILEIARMELYIEELFEDRLVVVAIPAAGADWARAWSQLPVRRALRAQALQGLPMILPERDATRRRQFDQWYSQHNGRAPNVAIEVGGWQNILRFAMAGLGIGLVTEQTIAGARRILPKRESSRLLDAVRKLDADDFPPDSVRLICRRAYRQAVPDLKPPAALLHQCIIRHSTSAFPG